MQFTNPQADIYAPDGCAPEEALCRTTHLGIGAHQDDLEFFALHGILHCFDSDDKWFTGVVCTDGGGSPRSGAYSSYSDDQMKVVRREEQRQAAIIGRYSLAVQLGYPSSAVKNPCRPQLLKDLQALISAAPIDTIYTHSLTDKHPTHVAVALAVIETLRMLPPEKRPRKLLGVEVWRDLDWLPDQYKVLLDVSGHEHIAAALSGVFDSQIAGGKRYDLAVAGRRRANATFLESHGVDRSEQLSYAMDLSPLFSDPKLAVADFVSRLINNFADEVLHNIRSYSQL